MPTCATWRRFLVESQALGIILSTPAMILCAWTHVMLLSRRVWMRHGICITAWKHDKTHDFSCCIRQCNYASLILGEMSFFSVMFASMLEASESSEDVHARLQPAETWLVTVSPRRLPFDGRKQLKRSQPEGSQVSRRLLWRFTWKSSRRFSWRFFLKVKMFQSFELVPQTCFALRPVECRMRAQLGASAWGIRRNGENRKKREATSYI